MKKAIQVSSSNRQSQIITVPIASTQAFVYTGTLSGTNEKHAPTNEIVPD